jgi:Smg protein
MTTGSVLDILIYVFDRYMLDEVAEVPERAHLARDLESAGFAAAQVERALDWLTELALGHERVSAPCDPQMRPTALRVFSDSELTRLSSDCRGWLLTLERSRVLSAAQRELVIERLLALETDEADREHLKWVVLMVLSSHPGDEDSVERLGNLMAEMPVSAPH